MFERNREKMLFFLARPPASQGAEMLMVLWVGSPVGPVSASDHEVQLVFHLVPAHGGPPHVHLQVHFGHQTHVR